METGLSHIFSAIKERGPRFLLTYLKDIVLFDLIRGTRTRDRTAPPNQLIGQVYYVPCLTSVVSTTLNFLKVRLGNKFHSYQFMDIGCGKGKSLIIYGEQFSADSIFTAIGIEYDQNLVLTANSNLRKSKLNRLATAINDDALNSLKYLNSSNIIFFLYNPFFGDFFEKFIKSISSVSHFIIYVDPVEEAFLLSSGYTIEKHHTGRYHADTWSILYFDHCRSKN